MLFCCLFVPSTNQPIHSSAIPPETMVQHRYMATAFLQNPHTKKKYIMLQKYIQHTHNNCRSCLISLINETIFHFIHFHFHLYLFSVDCFVCTLVSHIPWWTQRTQNTKSNAFRTERSIVSAKRCHHHLNIFVYISCEKMKLMGLYVLYVVCLCDERNDAIEPYILMNVQWQMLEQKQSKKLNISQAIRHAIANCPCGNLYFRNSANWSQCSITFAFG